MSLADAAWVGLAGAAGAVARSSFDSAIRRRRSGAMPVGTITINVTGSFVLGVLTGLVIFHGQPTRLTLIAGTGFCGGYTTFSTAAFETVALIRQGDSRTGAAAAIANLAGALLGAAAGLLLAST